MDGMRGKPGVYCEPISLVRLVGKIGVCCFLPAAHGRWKFRTSSYVIVYAACCNHNTH